MKSFKQYLREKDDKEKDGKKPGSEKDEDGKNIKPSKEKIEVYDKLIDR